MSFKLKTKLSRFSIEKLLRKLKPYQKDAIEFGVSNPAAGFFLAPGLGKTLITLVVFYMLKKLGHVDELLVVAKKRIIYNVWSKEIEKWKFPFKWTRLHGPKKEKRLWKRADVRLINYDGLVWLKNQKEWLRRKKRVMLVCDESSKLKHSNTLRFKSLKKILPRFFRRYILTGSPASKGYMGLFSQIYVLDLGTALGKFITHYRNKYFQPAGPMGRDWELQYNAEKRIHKKVRKLVIRYGTDQLNLPPITFIDRDIKLPPKARKLYNDLERDLFVKVAQGEIVAANAAVATGKLRQIANGGVYYSKDGIPCDEKKAKYWKAIHDEKIADLVELLDELQGEPALVSFEFGHDRERLQKYFQKNAPEYAEAPFIHGQSKDKEVSKWLKLWDRGKLPVLFGNMVSVAHGLNLQGKGGIVIYHALTWSLEDYEQFYQRVWRQGQTRRVLVYRQIVRNTVDEDMMMTLKRDDKTQRSLLKAMERRYADHDRDNRRNK